MNSLTPGEDRRKYKRAQANFSATFTIQGPHFARMITKNELIHTIMFDVSEGGLSVITNFNIPQSSDLDITFLLMNPRTRGDARNTTIQISGEVRYNAPLAKNEHRLGIRFFSIDEKHRKDIAVYVQT